MNFPPCDKVLRSLGRSLGSARDSTGSVGPAAVLVSIVALAPKMQTKCVEEGG